MIPGSHGEPGQSSPGNGPLAMGVAGGSREKHYKIEETQSLKYNTGALLPLLPDHGWLSGSGIDSWDRKDSQDPNPVGA